VLVGPAARITLVGPSGERATAAALLCAMGYLLESADGLVTRAGAVLPAPVSRGCQVSELVLGPTHELGVFDNGSAPAQLTTAQVHGVLCAAAQPLCQPAGQLIRNLTAMLQATSGIGLSPCPQLPCRWYGRLHD
ncbi:MAG: hypothetical protein M3N95_05995, partial [Actinomycetota bacterium]|nr:hypothetical protein [Actinomycetota bacterium]